MLLQQSYKAREQGEYEQARQLHRQAQQLPSHDPDDPDYRRLRYIRYADDTLLGFTGPKEEAEEIKQRLAEFLRKRLKLELSQEKTLITHAATQAAHFLGYAIITQQANDKLSGDDSRRVNGRIGLLVPAGIINRYCAEYKEKGKPVHRPELTLESEYTIVRLYQSEYRGIVQYYMLAQNVSGFWKLHWVMQTSLLKTLAHKHQTSVAAIARKYRSVIETPEGDYRCIKVTVERQDDKPALVAYFGGISLRRQRMAILEDQNPLSMRWAARSELVQRLLANQCELCGSQENIEVHHIHKLADLKTKGRREQPRWMQVMKTRRRKTLVVCKECHTNIHAGRPIRQRNQT